MKTIIPLFFFLFFLQCKTTSFVKKPIFKILEATYHTWVGGQAGASGTNIKISLENASNVNFKNFYFREKKTDIKINKTSNNTIITGYFPNKHTNLVIDKEPLKEFKNKVPSDVKEFPFQIEKDEIVIEYTYKKEVKFFKTKLSKKPTKQFK